MNEFTRFEQLTAEARCKSVPPLDVTGGVLRDIRRAVVHRGIDGPLALFSGVAVLAASVMAAVVVPMWLDLADPLSSFFDVLTVVMQ